MISLEAIKSVLAKASAWSLPTKLLCSGLIGTLAGSGTASFLLEYATYGYAIYYGFRPPVEGIPHLRAAVVGGSFWLLTTGAAVAAGMIFLGQRSNAIPIPSSRTKLRVGVVSAVLGVIVLVLPYACSYWEILSCRGHDARILGIPLRGVAGFFIGVSASTLSMWRPSWSWWIAAAAVFSYYVSIVSILFSPEQHASMLRATGFGGGIPVSVYMDSESRAQLQGIEGILMLRTSEYLVLFDEASRRFFELPTSRIRQISYSVNALAGKGEHLPR